MVTVGVDAHKRTHTLVAVDDVGRKLGERTVAATSEGHLDALTWASRWTERTFAVEDCRHVTRLLESDLLRAGQAVLRVPTRLMAGARRGGRERGKSDPIDALAVARAALREPNTSAAFRNLLDRHGIRQSLSRPRQCWDNAVAESFFSTLKTELIHRQPMPTRAAARQMVFEYIEVFYNRQRLHSALGYRSPAEYERETLAQPMAATAA